MRRATQETLRTRVKKIEEINKIDMDGDGKAG
jgi:hypothetical protein